MNDPLHALLAKLQEHRADPLNPDLAGELHQLAAGAESALGDLIARFAPKGAPSAPAASPAQKVAPPAAPSDEIPPFPVPGLPPELAPPETNWGTNQRLDTAREARQPVDGAQARNVLELALLRKIKAKPIGTSHSASAVFTTDGVLVDTGALIQPGTSAVTSTLRQCRELTPGFYRLAEGARSMHVEIGSGAQVKDVNAYLAASGRALSMTGAYTGQTLVGAFCTSTHGAGVQHPPLHASVRSIQLLTADKQGAVVELRIEPSQGITDPEAYARGYPQVKLVQDDAWFRTAVVAMGAVGLITSVIIEVTSAYNLLQEDWKCTWDECKKLLLDIDENGQPRWFAGSYHAGLTLNPYALPLSASGRQAVSMSRSFVRPTPPASHKAPSQSGLSELLVEAARFVGNELPALTPFMIDRSLGGDPGTPTWGPSYQVLGNPDNLPPGFSAEYAFPLPRYMEAIEAILARMKEIAANDVKYIMGGLTLRWVGKNDAFLSMSEGSDRVYAEFLCLANAGQGAAVLAEIEKIALDFDGRPHWGQWFSPGAVPRMAGMYPRYADWKEVAKQLDPSGLFASAFTASLP